VAYRQGPPFARPDFRFASRHTRRSSAVEWGIARCGGGSAFAAALQSERTG